MVVNRDVPMAANHDDWVNLRPSRSVPSGMLLEFALRDLQRFEVI